MIEIASSLNYVEFDEVKDYATTFEMWKNMKDIYGGDDNVKRAKVESLRGQFDQMKMREDDVRNNKVERMITCKYNQYQKIIKHIEENK